MLNSSANVLNSKGASTAALSPPPSCILRSTPPCQDLNYLCQPVLQDRGLLQRILSRLPPVAWACGTLAVQRCPAGHRSEAGWTTKRGASPLLSHCSRRPCSLGSRVMIHGGGDQWCAATWRPLALAAGPLLLMQRAQRPSGFCYSLARKDPAPSPPEQTKYK